MMALRNEIMLQVTEQSLLVRTHVYSSASRCGHVHVQVKYGTVVCRMPMATRNREYFSIKMLQVTNIYKNEKDELFYVFNLLEND